MKIELPHLRLPKVLQQTAKQLERPLAKALGHAQASAFEGVRQVAQQASRTVAAVAAPKPRSFLEKVGSFFSGVASRVGDAAHSLVSGVSNAAVGVVKNLGEAAGTFLGGFGKLLRGDVGGAFKAWGSGLLKVVQTPVDATLMLGASGLSALQTVLGLEPPARKLSGAEIAALRKVYGDSIDYSRVQVKTGDLGLLGLTGRAFTMGDTIYIPKASLNPDGSIPPETLVHEMAHVWQHQNGGTDYLSEALYAQNFGDGYDWKKGLDQGKSFSQLNPEQQAELISTASAAGYFDNPSRGFWHNGTDYTAQLEAALADVRARRGAP